MRRDRLYLAGHQLQRDHALDAVVVYQELGHKPLVIAGDCLEFECGLKQRVQKVEPGLIGSKPRAHFLHATECPHGNVAVGIPAPGATRVLEAQ